MAKKKEEEVVSTGRAKVFKDFEDDFFSADAILGENKKVVSISPSFDLATGGVPEGCFMALTGREKCGKSVLSLWVAAQAQKLEYANTKLCPEGRHVFYADIEHRLKERDLAGVPCLDVTQDRFTLIRSSPGKILTSEDYCTRIERVVNEVPGCVVVVDSFSMLSSGAEMSADIGYQDRGKSNTIISQLMRKIAAPLAVNKCIVIGITHGMANTSGYGAAFVEKSANALKYAEDIKLAAKSTTDWRVGSDEKSPRIGHKCEWLVQFAAIFAPGARLTTHFRYGVGIDIYSELAEIAVELALIDKGGAWYEFSFLGQEKNPKYNGLEQVRNALEENPEWYSLLRKQVYEMAGCNHLIDI